jgi:hypothetical protein
MRRNAVLMFAVFVLAVPAFAAVTFNPSTMTGSVGKGDVQLAFGWNNKQMQQNQNGVGFVYESKKTYVQSCVLETKKNDVHKDFSKTAAIAADVSYDTRQKNQMVGFNLTGADVVSDETVASNLCPGLGGGFEADPFGAYPSPTLVPGEGSDETLYVTFGDRKIRLSWPPAPVLIP